MSLSNGVGKKQQKRQQAIIEDKLSLFAHKKYPFGRAPLEK